MAGKSENEQDPSQVKPPTEDGVLRLGRRMDLAQDFGCRLLLSPSGANAAPGGDPIDAPKAPPADDSCNTALLHPAVKECR